MLFSAVNILGLYQNMTINGSGIIESHILIGVFLRNLSQKELTYCGDKSSIEGVLRESEEYAGFSNPRISNEQQFEKVVVSLSHPEAELYLTL